MKEYCDVTIKVPEVETLTKNTRVSSADLSLLMCNAWGGFLMKNKWAETYMDYRKLDVLKIKVLVWRFYAG